MSRKIRIEGNKIFDNGLDDLSNLENEFKKKSKRVYTIFKDDEAQVTSVINDKETGHKKSISPIKTVEIEPEKKSKEDIVKDIQEKLDRAGVKDPKTVNKLLKQNEQYLEFLVIPFELPILDDQDALHNNDIVTIDLTIDDDDDD